MRAATCVNTEQGSQPRRGSRPATMQGKSFVFGEVSEISAYRFQRDSAGSTHGGNQVGNKGRPSQRLV